MVLASLTKPRSLCSPTETWSFACKQPSSDFFVPRRRCLEAARARATEVPQAISDIHMGWQVPVCSRAVDQQLRQTVISQGTRYLS